MSLKVSVLFYLLFLKPKQAIADSRFNTNNKTINDFYI